MYEFKIRKYRQKATITVLKTNYDSEKNNPDVEKLKNHRKQNFKKKANNIRYCSPPCWIA